MTLREAWTDEVTADDYELHMARIGQAQANAELVRQLLAGLQLAEQSRVLIAGAGTGQMFEYLTADVFTGYRLVCSDINREFLTRLESRYGCEVAEDDIEDSRLSPGFAVIVVVLVLEHVDWHKALVSLARLEPERLVIVIQENPAAMKTAVTPGRLAPGTMRVFAEQALPHLIPPAELTAELARLGFGLEQRQDRPVADGKKMVGLVFTKTLHRPR